jgi:hypothetical protein
VFRFVRASISEIASDFGRRSLVFVRVSSIWVGLSLSKVSRKRRKSWCRKGSFAAKAEEDRHQQLNPKRTDTVCGHPQKMKGRCRLARPLRVGVRIGSDRLDVDRALASVAA